ncbi:MAG: hypothetical protein KME07_19075 [Pegethrix bostrychoides GSE-TBD4-15B]|uniref:Uncharacterized protein n=1 Tax=Pegethrix bostrychoides GSE-TBD4-15B TaxID=2839662 RepID=A0A951U653_9CYAN|nr:hypothetical protein [Pegethrix bostrychoides GSE-TBD4-15B]
MSAHSGASNSNAPIVDPAASEYQDVSEHPQDRDPLTQLRPKAAKPSAQTEDDFRLLIRL